MRSAATLVLVLTFGISISPLAESRSSIPTPASVFGFEPGADYKLATYDQSIEYFRRLAASSKYIRLVEAGKTSQGRTMYFALISTPDNLSRMERNREIWQRLAHPQGLTDAQAEQLAHDGKALVHIDGGLHSTEVAGPQHTPLLAYDLLRTANQPATRAILENVVLMLWPTINPDGQQMVADWYMKNVGTPSELSGLPQLYQEYVGHDNNRDAYMLNMIESRAIEHTWRQWEPQIIYVHHQSGPFPTRIWLPPFSDPVGVDAPYLMSREVNMVGMAIAKRLEEHGQVGATHMGTAFDAWYPGYIDYAPNFKNIVAFWTETALYRYATPHEYTINDFPQNMRDLRPGSLYASPWPPGPWRLRDAVDYMETASLAVLEYASKYKDSLLFDRYKAGRDQIARGRREPPYAYVIPQRQRDPVAAVELLRRLAFGGVRVSQLTDTINVDDVTWPAGTWVVPTDQEFAALAREVLNIQQYPDVRQYPGGPPERPYDAAGWTLPLQMGVSFVALKTPLTEEMRARMKLLGPMPDVKAEAEPYNASTRDAAPFDSVPGAGFDTSRSAAAIVPPDGRVTGTGTALTLDPAQNNAYRAMNHAWTLGARVTVTNGRFGLVGLTPDQETELVSSLALVAERGAAGTVIRRPRIGLFRPSGGSIDEGWTRWVLEQYGFEYVTLRPADFKTPLADRVDVVILADDARVPIERASRGGTRGGVRAESADRLSATDLASFEGFIRSGGTLVCLNTASNFAIDHFKLPVKNVVAELGPDEFFLHGTIVQVTTDPLTDVMAGMPEKAAIFVDNSPVFETLDGFEGHALAKYQAVGSPLLSGYLIGDEYLNGKAAALDVDVDAGHIILLGFRPEWRGQSFGTFKVLFNAAISAVRRGAR
jgi:ribosomal protein S18 acetylase RimI-like enzyme